MHRRGIALVMAALGSLAPVGCGDSGSGGIGQAGDKAKATRTVEIRQVDALRFEPSAIEVKPDETVTIRVTNTGTLIHEFFLGDSKAQNERKKLMTGMGSSPMNMPDMSNSVTLDPGASEELTWTFPKKGKVEFGCHQPGHHDKGMKGTFTVKG